MTIEFKLLWAACAGRPRQVHFAQLLEQLPGLAMYHSMGEDARSDAVRNYCWVGLDQRPVVTRRVTTAGSSTVTPATSSESQEWNALRALFDRANPNLALLSQMIRLPVTILEIRFSHTLPKSQTRGRCTFDQPNMLMSATWYKFSTC